MNKHLNYSLNEAIRLFNNRKFKEARELLKAIIQNNPNDSEAWRIAAQIDLDEYGLISLAFDELIESLRLQSNNIAALLTMGNLFMVYKKDYETAKNYFEKILDYNPKSVKALYNLGVIHQKSGNFNDALIFFNKCIITNPTLPNGWYGMASLYHIRKQYTPMFNSCLDGVKKVIVTPETEEMHYKLGQLLRDSANQLTRNIDFTNISNHISREIELNDKLKVYCKEYNNNNGITSFLGFGPDRQLNFHNIVYNTNLPDVEYRILHELIHLKILQYNYNIGIRIPYTIKDKAYQAFYNIYFSLYQNMYRQSSLNQINKIMYGHYTILFSHLNSGIIDLFIQFEIYNNYKNIRPAQLLSFICELKRKDQRALDIKESMPEMLYNKMLMLNHLESLNLKELYGINLLSDITMPPECIDTSEKLFKIYRDAIKCNKYRECVSNTLTQVADFLHINI